MVKVSPRTKKTTFQIEIPDARSVRLVGEFNNWNDKATPMKRGGKGLWKADLSLPAGRYQFRYFVDETRWVNDDAAASVPNQFGSFNSMVEVQFPAKSSKSRKAATKKAASNGKSAK